MSPSLLVVGARPGSIGEVIAQRAEKEGFFVGTAGLSKHEHFPLDVQRSEMIRDVVHVQPWHHVICTAGVNLEGGVSGTGWLGQVANSHRVNFMGPLILLSEWCRYWRDILDVGENLPAKEVDVRAVIRPEYLHFAAISSNSAHIARSKSLGYCTSKAALSMAVRCVAREMATHPAGFVIYGYEPGWVDATPMSDSVQNRLDARDVVPHRIPGARTLKKDRLAAMVVHNLMLGGSLNGCVLRVDGGEQ